MSKRRVEPALTDLVRRQGLREDRPQREDLQQQEQQAQGKKKVKGNIRHIFVFMVFITFKTTSCS